MPDQLTRIGVRVERTSVYTNRFVGQYIVRTAGNELRVLVPTQQKVSRVSQVVEADGVVIVLLAEDGNKAHKEGRRGSNLLIYTLKTGIRLRRFSGTFRLFSRVDPKSAVLLRTVRYPELS